MGSVEKSLEHQILIMFNCEELTSDFVIELLLETKISVGKNPVALPLENLLINLTGFQLIIQPVYIVENSLSFL